MNSISCSHPGWIECVTNGIELENDKTKCGPRDSRTGMHLELDDKVSKKETRIPNNRLSFSLHMIYLIYNDV